MNRDNIPPEGVSLTECTPDAAGFIAGEPADIYLEATCFLEFLFVQHFVRVGGMPYNTLPTRPPAFDLGLTHHLRLSSTKVAWNFIARLCVREHQLKNCKRPTHVGCTAPA